MVLPGAELFGEGVLDLEAVAAFGGEVDVVGPGEELFFFVFAVDAACVFGDDLDALEGGAFAAGVGAYEADVGPEGTAGAALVAVEDEPHGPLPGVVVEADFLDVTLGKGACGFVALGGVVGDGELFGLHCGLGFGDLSDLSDGSDLSDLSDGSDLSDLSDGGVNGWVGV